jgi:8-oxo-dGTP diphosphatase
LRRRLLLAHLSAGAYDPAGASVGAMPRFCSACGANVGTRAPTACPACGKAHWPHASPAACALVVERGRLLLTRRAIEPWRGMWCAPGGFCDGAEHPIACATRETLEETGVRIEVIGYLGHWISEYAPAPDDASEPQHCAVSYFHAVPVEPADERPDGVEVADVAWFAAAGLPASLAPPDVAPEIYAAWRDAVAHDRVRTALPDRPR